MESNIIGMAIVTVILLFLSGIASVFETSLTSVNRLKIKIKAEDGNKKAIKIMKLIEKYDISITSIVVFDNLINIILPTMSLLFFISILNNEATAATISTIMMTTLVIIFGEIVPKIYGRVRSESALYAMVGPFTLLVTIMTPIAWMITKLTDFSKKVLFPKNNIEEDLDGEMLTMLDEEHEQGNIKSRQKDLIENAIKFNDTTVEMIMQGKSKVVMVSLLDTNASIYKQLIISRFSRIPVFNEDKNEVIGILNEREFLSNYAKNKQFDKNEVISEAYFVPDTMKVATLLTHMQKTKIQLAIVIDEYGTTQGIISIEDIIEEIVGEIWDEHDEVVKMVRRIRPNQYLVESDLLMSDVKQLIDINCNEEDITIAKYILNKLQTIPDPNHVIEGNGYKIIVKSIEDNHIKKVLLVKLFSKLN